jgi:hypothetical protein
MLAAGRRLLRGTSRSGKLSKPDAKERQPVIGLPRSCSHRSASGCRPARKAFAQFFGFATLLITAAGCSSTVKEGEAGDIEGLRKIASAYSRATAKNGRPPAKPADLNPFLAEGEDVDRLLASSRDGHPYVIFWGVDPRPGKGGPSPLVIGHEKTGKNGSRFVFLDMGVVSMADSEFAKANFPPGRKPE